MYMLFPSGDAPLEPVHEYLGFGAYVFSGFFKDLQEEHGQGDED
ncbi:hypothetical protein [Peribacillus kribbensis]|nr:hypothetical protein [Peribacillus kribbensis]